MKTLSVEELKEWTESNISECCISLSSLRDIYEVLLDKMNDIKIEKTEEEIKELRTCIEKIENYIQSIKEEFDGMKHCILSSQR